MADHRQPLPLSGEIVTSGPQRMPRPEAEDIHDAEFEIVPVSPGTARRSTTPRPQEADFSGAGLEVLSRPPPRPPLWQPGGPGFWAKGLGIALAAFWVSGGHALFLSDRVGQASGDPVRVERFESLIVDGGPGGPVIRIEGALANDGTRAVAVPRFSIDVATESGRTIRYFLGTSDAKIGPGGRFDFSSRLRAPKDRVETVKLTFSKDGSGA